MSKRTALKSCRQLGQRRLHGEQPRKLKNHEIKGALIGASNLMAWKLFAVSKAHHQAFGHFDQTARRVAFVMRHDAQSYKHYTAEGGKR